MNKFKRIAIVFVIICQSFFHCVSNISNSQSFEESHHFLHYPSAYHRWEFAFMSGISLAKLPVVISENEISHSPMLRLDFRIGLPYEIFAMAEISTNYISNLAGLSFGWTFFEEPIAIAVGTKISGWFGHLELDNEDFSSRGWILSPFITAGIKFEDIYTSFTVESQHSRYYTFSQNEFIGLVRDNFAGIAAQLKLEQPLWSDNYVLLGIKVTYSKFFYQSWLSYSTNNDLLIYPEIFFGIIL